MLKPRLSIQYLNEYRAEREESFFSRCFALCNGNERLRVEDSFVNVMRYRPRSKDECRTQVDR